MQTADRRGSILIRMHPHHKSGQTANTQMVYVIGEDQTHDSEVY